MEHSLYLENRTTRRVLILTAYNIAAAGAIYSGRQAGENANNLQQQSAAELEAKVAHVYANQDNPSQNHSLPQEEQQAIAEYHINNEHVFDKIESDETREVVGIGIGGSMIVAETIFFGRQLRNTDLYIKARNIISSKVDPLKQESHQPGPMS